MSNQTFESIMNSTETTEPAEKATPTKAEIAKKEKEIIKIAESLEAFKVFVSALTEQVRVWIQFERRHNSFVGLEERLPGEVEDFAKWRIQEWEVGNKFTLAEQKKAETVSEIVKSIS